MKSLFACAILTALVLIVVAEPAAAQPEMSIPFVTAPQFIFFMPSHFPALTIVEANTSSLSATDSEAFALSFAPGPGSLSARPTIAQTSSRTMAAEQTYLFRDFISS